MGEMQHFFMFLWFERFGSDNLMLDFKPMPIQQKLKLKYPLVN